MPSARPSPAAPAAVGVGDGVEADVAEARLALADQDRRAVDQDAVDQIGGEEGGGGGRSAFDQQVVDVMKSVHILRRRQHFPALDRLAAGQQGAARRSVLEPGQADVEPRRVGEIGAAPDQDHVAVGALEMDVGAGILAGDPFRFARGQRDLAVDRQRQLERDARAAEREPGEIAGHACGARPRRRRRSSTLIPAACEALRSPARRCAGRDPRSRRRRGRSRPRRSARSRSGRARCDGRRARGWCRASRRFAFSPASASATASAWGRPPGCGRAAADDLRRPATITQPTLGLGAVGRARASPSAIASAIQLGVTQCRAASRASGTGAAALLARGVALGLVLLLVGDDLGVGAVGR